MSRRARNEQEPPEGMPQLPPRQIIHPIAQVSLGDADAEGNRVLIVHTLGPNTLQVFPLGPAEVKALGDEALAPHIETASPADVAELAEALSGSIVVPGGSRA